MADLRDEHGNPIQLTDEQGNPVQLTDEFGNLVHISGTATTKRPIHEELVPGSGVLASSDKDPEDALKGGVLSGSDKPSLEEAMKAESWETGEHGGLAAGFDQAEHKQDQDDTSSTSSSGTSEDDGQGGRRRKKGLKEKIKEKLTGHGKHKEEHGHRVEVSATTGPGGEVHHYEEHEKKSVIERIKERLPGHHNHH